MQGEINTDVSFYVKKLNNHAVRMAHSLYSRKALDECSLMNMWVADFLYNNRGEDVFQKDIEAEFFITRATASKMLTLMEEKKLIRRTSVERDGRYKKIELEPRGVQLHEMCLSIREEVERRFTAALTAEETAQFKALCRRILQSLE